MLSLTRKNGQSIQVGSDIVIFISRTRKGSARVSIDAPKQVKIMRSELTQQSNPQ